MTDKTYSSSEVARICHEMNKRFCELTGDNSQVDWYEAEEWQRGSAVSGVSFIVENPNADNGAVHESWLKQKLTDGWVYGPVKDTELKTHPCCVAYDELPAEQKTKDAIFKAVVLGLIGKK